jgi:hypothetical protein
MGSVAFRGGDLWKKKSPRDGSDDLSGLDTNLISIPEKCSISGNLLGRFTSPN